MLDLCTELRRLLARQEHYKEIRYLCIAIVRI